MTRILVPYHLDEHLADLDVPLAADSTVTVDLGEGDPWVRMARLYEGVAAAVAEAVRAGARPAVLSGDCTTSIGTVAGLQRAGVGPAIVWLVAAALGLRAVGEERVVLVDARDLDPPEVAYLEEAAIRRCEVDDLSTDRLPDGPLYLHLDVDVVNPEELPGLRFPAAGGPGWSRVTEALGRVIATGQVAALGVGCTWHGGRGAGERARPHLESVLTDWE